MKIIQLIPAFEPAGAEILTREISKYLSINKRLDIKVIAMSKSRNKEFEDEYIKLLQENGISYDILKKTENDKRISCIKKLRKIIKLYSPDLINTHCEYGTVYIIVACIGLNVKIVQTIHNVKITYKLLQRTIINWSINSFVAISDTVKKVLINEIKIKEKKIDLIYNGINLKKFKSDNRVINEEVKSIICVGRLSEQKNHKFLIDSYKKFILQFNSGKNIPKLVIYGSGCLEEELNSKIIELGLSEYVYIHKPVHDIKTKLDKADLYIMSSSWEGLSISLIEAVATKIPIIATNVGSNNEIIKNEFNGYLVESNNTDALITALNNLIKNKNKRIMFSNNCDQVIFKFNIFNTVNNYYNLYKKLIENN